MGSKFADDEAAQQTREWLLHNYCENASTCLPRCVIYSQYKQFCRKSQMKPLCPASFGKVIRNVFQTITTRRLGTRGHSRYHYYGLSIRGTPTNSHCMIRCEQSRSLLPEFPSIQLMPFMADASAFNQINVMVMMYRGHCQCVLDTIISGTLEDVEKFVKHFWTQLPDHLKFVLGCEATGDLIAICDYILYQAIIDNYIPSNFLDLPSKTLSNFGRFVANWRQWVVDSIAYLPEQTANKKRTVVDAFQEVIRAYWTLAKMVTFCGDIFDDKNSMMKIRSKLKKIVAADGDFIDGQSFEVLKEFRLLFHCSAKLEEFTSFVDKYPDISRQLLDVLDSYQFAEEVDDDFPAADLQATLMMMYDYLRVVSQRQQWSALKPILNENMQSDFVALSMLDSYDTFTCEQYMQI